MNKKVTAIVISMATIASLTTAVMAKKGGISMREIREGIATSIATIIPKVKVVHAEAEFNGVKTLRRRAFCESDRKLSADSAECNIVSSKPIWRGNISGFVDGSFVAWGKAVNDRRTGWGYVEGKIRIYDSNRRWAYQGKFYGSKEQILPVIAEASDLINETNETNATSNGTVSEVAPEIYPFPREWEIKGSMDLVGRGLYSRRDVFLNFEADLRNDGNEATVEGEMDGVLVFRRPIPIPLPLETFVEEALTATE